MARQAKVREAALTRLFESRKPLTAKEMGCSPVVAGRLVSARLLPTLMSVVDALSSFTVCLLRLAARLVRLAATLSAGRVSLLR
jgi:hypothetical protein